jgi:hypothetical protein
MTDFSPVRCRSLCHYRHACSFASFARQLGHFMHLAFRISVVTQFPTLQFAFFLLIAFLTPGDFATTETSGAGQHVIDFSRHTSSSTRLTIPILWLILFCVEKMGQWSVIGIRRRAMRNFYVTRNIHVTDRAHGAQVENITIKHLHHEL